MNKPRIFVGTMYSGENELAESIESIHSQVGVDVTHYVVRDKREIEAHKDLYSTWNSVKQNYDMFVQVDADTVILHSTIFEIAFNLLQIEIKEGYTSLQFPLEDYITNQKIMGLNFYSPLVIFNVPQDEVYCDRSTTNNKTFLSGDRAGYHSPNPTYRQAFHFGLHRGLKGQRSRYENYIKYAYSHIQKDDRRIMTLLGFDASDNFKGHKRTSYTDDEFGEAYVSACELLPTYRERFFPKNET